MGTGQLPHYVYPVDSAGTTLSSAKSGAQQRALLAAWGRRQRRSALRVCPHCEGEVDTAEHMALRCPHYAEQRVLWADLFAVPHTLPSFLQQPAERLAAYVSAIRAARLGRGGGL